MLKAPRIPVSMTRSFYKAMKNREPAAFGTVHRRTHFRNVRRGRTKVSETETKRELLILSRETVGESSSKLEKYFRLLQSFFVYSIKLFYIYTIHALTSNTQEGSITLIFRVHGGGILHVETSVKKLVGMRISATHKGEVGN